MAKLSDIVSTICKEYKDNTLIVKSNVTPNYKRLPCGAFGMDYPLFGGLPYGRICMYSGQPHSGKTTAAVVEMAAFQRANPEKTCVYVDVEHSLDLQFQAKMTGLDLNRMYYMNPAHLSGEQILDAIIDMQKDAEDIGMIVLDSIPALLPADVLENDISKDVGMRGTIAKPLHKFLIEMSSLLSKKENILILINQVRQVGTTFTGAPIYKEPGGDGPRYYSSVSVCFGTRTFTLGENMNACKPDGEGADGYRIRFKITKNKTAPCNRGGGFITFRYDTGLDWIHDLLEIAIQFNFIQRLNNITYQLIDLETGEILTNEEGKELKGKKSDLIEYIKNNIAFQTKYLDMLTKYISADNVSYGSLLDERTIKEIDAEETSITA